jgi:NADH:ubiquinone oxidoreductase subunit E
MNNKFKPGDGRRKKFAFDKGRQVDLLALEEVKELIPFNNIRRDHLIEYLHFLQDKYKFLYSRHLRALAELMKLSMAEVFEVASFYAHFTIVDDGEKLPEITIRVCESLTCSLFGGDDLYEKLQNKHKGKIRILKAPCMGKCDFAPALEIEHNHIDHANVEKVDEIIKNKDYHPKKTEYISYNQYIDEGGLEVLVFLRLKNGNLLEQIKAQE